MKSDNQTRPFRRPNGNGWPVPVKGTLVVIAGISLLIPILVGLILSGGQQLIDYYQALAQSVQTRAEIRRVFSTLQDAQAAQRGYLLTGRQEFLDAYERARRELPGRVEALDSTVTRSSLKPASRRLGELVPAAAAELAREITTRQQGSQAAAAEMVAEGRAERYVDEIRVIVNDMLATENREIERLSLEVEARSARSRFILLVLFGGIILAGLVAAVAGLVHIAHRRKIERELTDAWQAAEVAHEEAERASRAKTEFLTTMSHEIRTPLHAVIGTADLLLDNDGLTVEQCKYLERIQISSTALLNLVNDVLDLAKIEAGEIELIPEPFSLETLVDNAVSIVQTAVQAKGLTLRVVLDQGLPLMVLGDQARLRQVLLNLLGNAVKFTDRGEISLRVEHRGSTEGGESLRFSITDTGPGIPESKRERLFKRFSQISQGRGGTGLGLTISKQLVELMGGEMGFVSGEDRGSTFWFSLTLPQVEVDASTRPSLEHVEHVEHGLTGRILVVDDLDQNRHLARKMLEGAGYTVDEASDGADAVAAVQATRYELVLMDIQMNHLDGATATKIIRGLDDPAKDVPIVAMTANVLAHDVKSFKAAGMNDHLGKPFNRKQLLDKVRQWLHAEGADSRRGAQNAALGQSPDPNHNETRTIEELCSMMGPEWVVQGLSELKDHIELTFDGISAHAADRDALARQAHALVARAGFLGFAKLARLCGELERACRRGEPLGPAFSETRKSAIEAQAAATQILQTLKRQRARVPAADVSE